MKSFAATCLAIAALAGNASAQSYYHQPKPVAAFGGAVAVTETSLFVAEPSGFTHPGRVHIYNEADGAWHITQHLEAPDAAVGDGFGRPLAASGTTVLTSARTPSRTYFFELVGNTWTQAAQLPFGASSLAVQDHWALIGVVGGQDQPGQVFVYRKSDSGWEETAQLTAEVPGFGTAVALDGNVALVGARGAVCFYRWDGTTFVEEACFQGPDLGIERGFGAAVHINGNSALVGAPTDQQFTGSVQVFRYREAWEAAELLRLENPERGERFGTAVAATAEGFWVGIPGINGGTGELQLFPSDDVQDVVVIGPGADAGRTGFGMTLAIGTSVALVGMPSAAYGEGSARLLVRDEDVWALDAELFVATAPLDPILGGDAVQCDAGAAAGYECGQVDLVSFLPLSHLGTNRGVRLSDVWGWTDPETGKEYGLVGHLEGTIFVDLSDPSMPIVLGELPGTAGSPGSTWRDIKTYKDHAFIVADGAGEHGMQVFDLTRLRAVPDAPAQFTTDAHYDGIHSAHNIVINEETGYAFAVGASSGGQSCGGGLHMIDLRQPLSPTFAGCFADESTGRRGTGYSHDAQCVIYHGPDAAYQGQEICIGSNETAISIADITDKENPVAISSGSYPDASYVHQGWLSEDHAFFYQNDELDEISQRVDRTRTLVWDVSDLDDPVLVNEYYGPTGATDHNLYVHENLMYQTNNASGLRIVDITDRAAPREVGFFDTTPYGTNDAGFNGTWSSYPYFKSGIIVVTSRREGLFIVKKQSVGS